MSHISCMGLLAHISALWVFQSKAYLGGSGARALPGVFTIPSHTPMQSYSPFPLFPLFLHPTPSYVSLLAHISALWVIQSRAYLGWSGARALPVVFTIPSHTPMQSYSPFPLFPLFLHPKPSYVSLLAHISALWVFQSRAYLGGSGARALPGVFTIPSHTPMQSYSPFPLSPLFLHTKPSYPYYVSLLAHISALWVIHSSAYLGGSGAKALPGVFVESSHTPMQSYPPVPLSPCRAPYYQQRFQCVARSWHQRQEGLRVSIESDGMVQGAGIMGPSVNGSGPWYKACLRAWAFSTTGKILISIDGIEDTKGINRFAQPAPVPAAQPVPAPAAQRVPSPAAQPVPALAAQPVLAPAVQPVPVPAFQPVPAPAAQPVPFPAGPFVPVPAAQVAPVTSAQAVPVPAARPGPAPAAQAGPALVTQAGPVQAAWGEGFLFV
ncbi:unnamed protein product [Closterium sp. NIES-65]|nr:unnamed protein product [Closterium sp. NIES-65]